MRARNREINIFNMSLLDILTGMLGAFLFLMLGLLPYYANKNSPAEVKQIKAENQALKDQVERQKQQLADIQKQLEELQKIVKQTGGGPLTADQIQKLMDELNQMRQQLDKLREQLQEAQNKVQQLQEQNKQLQDQVTDAKQEAEMAHKQMEQAQQQLAEANRQRDFYEAQLPVMMITSKWNTSDTDVDVFVMDPKGRIFGQKKEKILGQDVLVDGVDSHTPDYKSNNEGLLAYVHAKGDYLVFYRIPPNSDPSTYSGLMGFYFLYGIQDMEKNIIFLRQDIMPASNADGARPGGLYAWCVLQYDDEKLTIHPKPLPDKLPDGLLRSTTYTPPLQPSPSP